MHSLRVLAAASILVGVVASGVSLAQADAEPIVVIEVGDPIDQRLIDAVVGHLTSEVAHAYVLKIDSPGVSSGDIQQLYDAVDAATAPVISWIGPNPAVAYGGAALLANHADLRSGAPGSSVGYLEPLVHRGPEPVTARPGDDPEAFAQTVAALADTVVVVGDDGGIVPGFVDRLDPALGQLLVSIDGAVVERGGEVFTLSTARTETIEGREVIVQTRPVTFTETGLLDRFLRLGANPETAFLFLVFGLAFAVFEFYAAGSGLMAFVSALSLVLSGYGLATLPIWWPAVVMTIAGVAVLVWGFVLNRTDWRTFVGAALMVGGGLTFTTTRPQYPPSVWLVLVATAAAVVFIWYSLTTVVRGRFATPTIGREDLIGMRCLVVETLDPFGVVAVDGARWQATADRGVEIAAGAAVEIVGVTGLLLEVDPVQMRPDQKSP